MKSRSLSGPLISDDGYRQALRDTLAQSGIPEGVGAVFDLSPQGQLGFGADCHPSVRQAEQNASELTQFLKEWMGDSIFAAKGRKRRHPKAPL